MMLVRRLAAAVEGPSPIIVCIATERAAPAVIAIPDGMLRLQALEASYSRKC